MKRLLVRLVALAVLGLLVTIPAWGSSSSSSSSASEPTTITDYRADFTVAADGDLSAVETLTVDFPVGVAKHGIFRFFDTHDPTDAHVRRVPHDIEVTQDGRPAIVDLSEENSGRERVVRIGDPDQYVDSGSHVYRISYRIDGALEKGTGDTAGSRTQFYWNLIPPGWAQAIDKARLHVSLPAAANGVECALGTGSAGGCQAKGDGTTSLTVTTGALAPQTPVTIKAGLDIATPPAGKTLPWAGEWDGVLGEHAAVPFVAGLLALLAAVLGGFLAARAREENPGFPLQYAPPDSIGPAQANYVRTERVDRSAFVASVMQAAEKGAVKLSSDGDSWTIEDTGKGWQDTDEVTARVYSLLGAPGASFTASRKSVADGQKLKTTIDEFDRGVHSWSETSGMLTKAGLGGFGGFLVIASLVAAVAVVFAAPFASVWALVPGGFGIFGLGLLAVGASTRRTRSGRDLWSRVGGFHRVLSTPSSEARFDFSARKDLYTAYLPWAVAFGCAEAWAAKYRTEMGAEPPVPAYLGAGFAGGTGGYVDSMVDSFSATVDSAISSYEATQSSSSSGGGGFSGGGGGGGGGGGSW